MLPHASVFIVTMSDGKSETFLIIKFDTTYEQPARYIARAPIKLDISVTKTCTPTANTTPEKPIIVPIVFLKLSFSSSVK